MVSIIFCLTHLFHLMICSCIYFPLAKVIWFLGDLTDMGRGKEVEIKGDQFALLFLKYLGNA